MPVSTAPQSDDAMQQVIQVAGRQVVKWRRRRRWTLGISWLTIMLPWFLAVLRIHFTPEASVWLIVFPLFAGSIGLLAGILMRPMRRNPLNSLFESQDVQAIGPLAETMQMLLPEMAARAVPALLRLLPLVNEQNLPPLTAYQRTCLHRLLGNIGLPEEGAAPFADEVLSAVGASLAPLKVVQGLAKGTVAFNPQLADAILYAYLYMGNADDLHVVRRLARPAAQSHTQTVGAAGLSKTAAEILPLLEERVKQENVQAELLRGASAPMPGASALLHPAYGTAPPHQAELLRPGTKSEARLPGAASTGVHAPSMQSEASLQSVGTHTAGSE